MKKYLSLAKKKSKSVRYQRKIEKLGTTSTVRLNLLGLIRGINFAESYSRYSEIASTLKSSKLPKLKMLN